MPVNVEVVAAVAARTPGLARQAAASGDVELHTLYDELSAYGPIDNTPPDPADIALTIADPRIRLS